MNWWRGLIRVWAVASLVWGAGVVWHFIDGCFYFPDSPIFKPVCNTGEISTGAPVAGYLWAFDATDWLRWLSLLVGPPVAAFALGGLSRWVIRGFMRSV